MHRPQQALPHFSLFQTILQQIPGNTSILALLYSWIWQIWKRSGKSSVYLEWMPRLWTISLNDLIAYNRVPNSRSTNRHQSTLHQKTGHTNDWSPICTHVGCRHMYNHTSFLICRKTSFHSLCCWKGWGPLVYVTAEHSLSTSHNWIHTTPLFCGQRKSKISPLLLLSNPYLPMPRIMQDDSRIWVVAKENGHKCGDEFMPQSMPRSVDLQQSQDQHIWTVLDREAEELLDLFILAHLCQTQQGFNQI